MKKILITAMVAMFAVASYGQGLVKWQNSTTQAITTNGTAIKTRTTGQTDTYFIGALLVSTSGDVFANYTPLFYATNSSALLGVIGAGSSATMPFAGGTSFNYRVAVWSYSLGALDWSTVLGNLIFDGGNAFTDNTPQTGSLALNGSWFAVSGVGFATAATGPAPPTDLWGNAPLIQGFGLNSVTLVPEPSTFALAGLGAAAMLIFRRRK